MLRFQANDPLTVCSLSLHFRGEVSEEHRDNRI